MLVHVFFLLVALATSNGHIHAHTIVQLKVVKISFLIMYSVQLTDVKQIC